MPSRKKNKGKERKAKKAELEREKIESIRALVHETWTGWTRGIGLDGRQISQCNHGCDSIPDNNHPVTNFIDGFYSRNSSGLICVDKYLRDTFATGMEQ